MVLAALAVVALLAASPAHAWYVKGYVYCDNNMNGRIDEGDDPVDLAVVLIENLDGTYSDSHLTDHTGVYWFNLPDFPDDYRLTIDPSTLPSDAVIIQPPGGEYLVSLTAPKVDASRGWTLGPSVGSLRASAQTAAELNAGNVRLVAKVRTAPRSARVTLLFESTSLKPGMPATMRPPPTATLVPKRSAVP